jgi:hypothetical protein
MRITVLSFVEICASAIAHQTAARRFAAIPDSECRWLAAEGDGGKPQPSLGIVLLNHPDNDSAIEVIFPEQVTAKKQGSTESEHLYLFRPGQQGKRPTLRKVAQSSNMKQLSRTEFTCWREPGSRTMQYSLIVQDDFRCAFQKR